MKKRLLPMLLPDEGDRSRQGAYPTLAIKTFPYSEQVSELVWIRERDFRMMPYTAHFLYLLDPSSPIATNDWIWHQHHPGGIHKNEGKADPQEIRNVGWVKVVATNDPALIADGVLSIKTSLLEEYVKTYHLGAVILAEYTTGYIQNNENKPDQEYRVFNKDENGNIVAEISATDCEIVSVGEERIKIDESSFELGENYIMGAKVPGFLLDAPIPENVKVLSNPSITAAKAAFPFPSEPERKFDKFMIQAKIHAERKGFVTGSYWKEQEMLKVMETGNISNWMLSSALVNMTPERKKAIADAIYVWLPETLRQGLQWKKIEPENLTKAWAIVRLNDGRVKEGPLNRIYEMAPLLCTHYILQKDLLNLPKEA